MKTACGFLEYPYIIKPPEGAPGGQWTV